MTTANNIYAQRFMGNPDHLSTTASGVIDTYVSQGYQIINKWNYTRINGRYPCYTWQTFIRQDLFVYDDMYFYNAYEIFVPKNDKNPINYYAVVVRYYLIKTSGYVYVKQMVYKNNESVIDKSDNFLREYCRIPSEVNFKVMYGNLAALTIYNYNPLFCNFTNAIWKQEQDDLVSKYNSESVGSQKEIYKQTFKELTGQDIDNPKQFTRLETTQGFLDRNKIYAASEATINADQDVFDMLDYTKPGNDPVITPPPVYNDPDTGSTTYYNETPNNQIIDDSTGMTSYVNQPSEQDDSSDTGFSNNIILQFHADNYFRGIRTPMEKKESICDREEVIIVNRYLCNIV